MTEQAISPLRRRMIEDMAIRKFAQKTQHDYAQRVKDFANYLKRSPDTAKPEDVRGFQLHLASSGAGVPKINTTISALRFFFKVTLDRPDLSRHLSTIHEPRKVPIVLSPYEVARFLEAAPGIKYKAAFSVAYGAGLRVSEVAATEGLRYRFQAHDVAHRARQGSQGPLRDAFPDAARTSARLVSRRAAARMAVSGPEPNQPDHGTSTHARLPCRRRDGRPQEARDAAHLAAQLCDPSA